MNPADYVLAALNNNRPTRHDKAEDSAFLSFFLYSFTVFAIVYSFTFTVNSE